jgi:hypothetical protein
LPSFTTRLTGQASRTSPHRSIVDPRTPGTCDDAMTTADDFIASLHRSHLNSIVAISA